MTAEIISIAVAAPSGPYGRHLPAATAFVADAAAHLRAVAHAVGARLTELGGGTATIAAVSAAIRAAAERLRAAPAGLFVLSYAGHGGRVQDTSADELDGYDEAWALDDAPLIDDTLTGLLGSFHRDVHIVVISNCCYSGGMVDDSAGRFRSARAEGIATDLMASADGVGERWALDSRDEHGPAPVPAATNRIVIASCGDHQMMVLPDSSRLTMRVLEVVFPIDGDGRRRQAVDYTVVEAQVGGMASVSQTPVVLASGADKQRQAFLAQALILGEAARRPSEPRSASQDAASESRSASQEAAPTA